jgi:hypothetical protein
MKNLLLWLSVTATATQALNAATDSSASNLAEQPATDRLASEDCALLYLP